MKKKGLLIFSLLGGLVLTSCGDIQFDTKTPTDEGGNEIIPSDPEVLPDDPSTEDPSNPETPEIDLPEYVDNFIYTLLTYDYTSGVRFNLDISAYQIPTELESELIAFLNQFKNLKLVLVNHREAEVKETFAKLESNFNPNKKNPSGAVGLFQLMPDTARRLGVNPHVQHENIKGGIMYYQMMYKKYGSMDLALAAYNAGPGNVARYKGVPPFKETKAFIARIKNEYNTLKADPQIKDIISDTL